MRTTDYPLAEQRGPLGWDYLLAAAQSQGPRLSYIAYCVERAIHGTD